MDVLCLKEKKKKNEQLVSFLSYRPPQWSSSQSEKIKQTNKKKQNKPLQGFIFSESQKEYYLTVAPCWPISAIDKATCEVNLYWQEE